MPTPTLYKVQTPANTLHADALVSELLIEDGIQWNKNLVEEVFWKEEANIIVIPLLAKIDDKINCCGALQNMGCYCSVYHTDIVMNKVSLKNHCKI